MAVARKEERPARPAKVTSSTTSPDDPELNLRLLRAILDVPTNSETLDSKPRRPKTPLASAPVQNPKTPKNVRAASKDRKQGAFTSKKESAPSPPLSVPESKKLAMNCFNHSLKALSATVKKQHANRWDKPTGNTMKEIDGKPSRSRELKDDADEDFKITAINAECASVALAVLRLQDWDPDHQISEDARYKREQGAVMLLDRMITLKLRDQAQTEASKIMDQYWKRRKIGSGATAPICPSKKLTLASLICAKDDVADKKDFDMLTAYQSQILRLSILLGPAMIDQEFLQTVSIETKASPACMIVSGYERAYMSAKAASDNLRTIAQALCKISSAASRSAQSKFLALNLLAEAQLTKVLSWQLAKQIPLICEEYWAPIERLLRSLWGKCLEKDSSFYGSTVVAIARLQTGLEKFAIPTALPASLDLLLCELADINGDTACALERLNRLNGSAAESEQLFYACRIASVALQSQDVQKETSSYIERAAELLADALKRPIDLRVDDLVTVVKLRKSCYETLVSPTKRKLENENQATYHACFHAISAALRFCDYCWRQETLNEKLKRSVRLASLKGVENMLDIEAFAARSTLDIFLEYLKNMEMCNEIVSIDSTLPTTNVGDATEVTILHGLKIKISNILWRSHLHPSVVESTEISSMKLAQFSISCLDGLTPDELAKSALGPRLERISALCVLDDDIEAARAYITGAISHYISTAALSDAVETSLSKRTGEVWTDNASLASQLGRALHTRVSLFVSGNDAFLPDEWIYCDSSLPPMHQAVLLDHQLSYVLRKHAKLLSSVRFQSLVKSVVELSQQPQYQIWLIRFIASVAFRASKLPHLSPDSHRDLFRMANDVLGDGRQNEAGSLKPNSIVPFLAPYGPGLQLQLRLHRELLEGTAQRGLEVRRSLDQMLENLQSCNEPDKLNELVDDSECLGCVLETYKDQAFMLGDYETTIAALRLRISLEAHRIGPNDAVSSQFYTQVALCQMRLHDVKAASNSLEQADDVLKKEGEQGRHALLYRLARVEYDLAICDLTKCVADLNEAGTAFTKLWPREASLSSKEQIERDDFVARGALYASVLAFRQGKVNLASRFARQATKISVSIWSALEKHLTSQSVTGIDTMTQSLADGFSNLSIGTRAKRNPSQIAGARYWQYLDTHIRTLKHMVLVSSHAGIYEDSVHYIQSLEHLRLSNHNLGTATNPASLTSLMLAKAGNYEEAKEKIAESMLQIGEQTLPCGFASPVLTCCEAYIAQGDLELARKLLSKVCMLSPANEAQSSKAQVNSVVVEPKGRARRGVRKAEVVKGLPKRQKSTTLAKNQKGQSSENPSNKLCQFSHDQWVEQSRYNAIVLACRKDECISRDIDSENSQAMPSLRLINLTVQELHAKASSLLEKAWELLSADAFASVLTESAMALPAQTTHVRRTKRISMVQGGADKVSLVASQGSPSSDLRSSSVSSTSQMLESALEICNVLLGKRQHDCSTDLMHSVLKMEARISLLLNCIGQPFIMSSTDLVLRASQPKDCALERERIVSLAEQATQDRASLSIWPANSPATMTSETNFVAARLQNLPKTWSVLSLTLTEDKDELLLSKTTAGSDPFLVRIPLHRATDGDGADEFIFEDAEREMRQIIEAANTSSHDTRGALDKATRAKWHTDREMLDQRLASLLESIESIWLGGFRGVLSPQTFKSEQVKQFGMSLNKSLNKHLPSRQKGSVIDKRVDVHDHILETFLGLGDPGETNLDDMVMDLLYFVVDILQFNGERNAYDEIDWDVILVDILDALKSDHSTVVPTEPRHTILILDKELELFPWEALPCLLDHPVTRMPSLGSIFERLDQMHSQTSGRQPSAYTITKSLVRGTYILNPSGDLKSTQETFSPILANNLPEPNYTSLIATPPSESQFASLLTQSDILLYIGHGSGAQYIRPRTIRALSACAVTFLFGCSSAKMTTYGKFESTGMPRAYMLGHAPAMVGCLWDVTDREIDRVAVQTLVSWGLVDGEQKNVQDVLKRRGRKGQKNGKGCGGVGSSDGEKGTGKAKTLVEAVRDGREACVLRYLCGAAVVVYGIPVVLE